jgi:nucleotide-binding universal stress UspA family protein
MTEVKTLTVALELTEMDPSILKYVGFLCQSLPIEKIYFLHIESNLDLPRQLREQHPEVLTPFDESLEDRMRALVSEHLPLPAHISVDFDALEGKVLNTLIKQANLKQTDLLVVGQHQPGGNANFSDKLARKCPCSVLFVPQEFSLDIRNILLPTDFSEHSALALQHTLALSEAVEGDTIHLLNIYDVPSGYTKLGKTYTEFDALMKTYAAEDCAAMLKALKTGSAKLTEHYLNGEKHDRAALIQAQLKTLDCQLLVIGSKGRTNVLALFLGSLAEQLVRMQLPVPLLVVKQPGETLGLLEAMLEADI